MTRAPFRAFAVPRTARPLLFALALASPAVAQSPQFLLMPGKAGVLDVGMPVDTVLRLFGHSQVRLIDLQREGHFSPALEIRLARADSAPALVARIREWPCYVFAVTGIYVHDHRFRTPEGLGVGSTVGELRRAYSVRLNREEVHSVIVPDLRMAFVTSDTSFADSVRVAFVWMWSDPSEVRQQRCPERQR